MGSYGYANEEYIDGLLGHDEKYFENLIAFLDRHCSKDDFILDVGSGVGKLVRILLDRGYRNAFGVELDSGMVAIGRERLGLEGRLFDLENFPHRGRTFDVVTSFTVIEHVEDPAKFIDFKLGFLKDGGKFYIFVPNYHDPLNYLGYIAKKLTGEPMHKMPFNCGGILRSIRMFIKIVFHTAYKLLSGKPRIIRVKPLPPAVSVGGDADAVWCSSYLDVRNILASRSDIRAEEIEPPGIVGKIRRSYYYASIFRKRHQ